MSKTSKEYTLSGKSKEMYRLRYYKRMATCSKFREGRAKQSRRRTVKCKELGLCRCCGKPSRPSLCFCQDCSTRKGLQLKQREITRREEGFCMRCGKLPPLKSNASKKRPFCEDCYIKNLSGTTLKTPKHWKLLKEKLKEQAYVCVYSGKPLVLGENASLDHIFPVSRFPEKISEPTNIQWVDLKVNHIKRDLTHEEFMNLIESIYHHKK